MYQTPLGHIATITDERTIYFGKKGRVIKWDGNQYQVELKSNDGFSLIYSGFDRDQFRIVD